MRDIAGASAEADFVEDAVMGALRDIRANPIA